MACSSRSQRPLMIWPPSSDAIRRICLLDRFIRWRARYVDDEGQERAKGFRTKAAAQHWLNAVVAAQETGNYIDPRFGKTTLASFYREWSKRQVWVGGTRSAMNLAVNSA